MVSRIVCIMTIVGLASGAVWQGRPPVKPKEHAHKEGCYIEEINDVIPYGDMISPVGDCYRIECTRDSVEYASCGVAFTADLNCYVTEIDISRPYPSCCPDIKCEDNNLI